MPIYNVSINPSLIDDMVWWFDATETATINNGLVVDGDDVTSITCKKSGIVLSNTNGSTYNPKYNTRSINGKNSIYFTNTQNGSSYGYGGLSINGISTVISQTRTIFMVYKRLSYNGEVKAGYHPLSILELSNPIQSSINGYPNINVSYYDYLPSNNYKYNYMESESPFNSPMINNNFIDNISGESNSNTIICNYLSSNQIINQQFESNLFNKKLYGDIPSNNFTASTIIIGDISQNPYLSSDTSPYPYPPFGFHGHFCEFILFNRNLTITEYDGINQYLKHKWIGDYPTT